LGDEATGRDGLDRRYAAFLSYRHVAEDRGWAKWLVEALETFRTPQGLIRKGFRSRIGLLYRDEDENPVSADLGDQIEKSLFASDALILVASRSTPASRWIDREVTRFQELGRGDRILVLLTEGEPAEAYPPSLIRDPDREPIAADVRPRRDESQRLLKRRARLRLAASLLGCAFDDLYRRDARRRRRRWAGAIGLILLFALGGAGSYLWDAQTREQLRLERAATRISDAHGSDLDRHSWASNMFMALSRRGWPYARLPVSARELLGGSVRRAAVSYLRFPGEALPIVLRPWRQGAVAGLSDGSIYEVTDGPRILMGPGPCMGPAAGFMHCAITALDTSGERLVAGTNRGEVLVFDIEGRRVERRLMPSSLRIETVLALSGGRALASDASGTLFAIEGGNSRAIARGEGSVVSLLQEPGGGALVVRSNGLVQRLSHGGTLAQVARYEGPVRGAGFIQGRFYLLRIPLGQQTGGSLLEGTPENATSREDTDRVFALDVSEGVYFGHRGTWIVIGKGVGINMFDVSGRHHDPIGIDVPPVTVESQDVAFSFYGSIAPSGDDRRFYSVHQGDRALLIIDLEELARIDALLESSRNLRADLCRPDNARLFATLQLPRSTCD
jgi:hypothetical protein